MHKLLAAVLPLSLFGIASIGCQKEVSESSQTNDLERKVVSGAIPSPITDEQQRVSWYPLRLSAEAGPYRAIISSSATEAKSTGPKELWWGAEAMSARMTVDRLEVFENGEPRPVLRAFYADLAHVDALDLEIVDGVLNIVFSGGDAHASYRGRITCDESGMPMSRVVRSGEFPDNFYDKYERVDIPYID
ncbi:MAG: hypothetical protein IH945_08500 [Armatimonadetes bacterium]|nr:hypothetical protein [Armatimonadota bacterium]